MHTNFNVYIRRILLGILSAGIVLLSGSDSSNLSLAKKAIIPETNASEITITLPNMSHSESMGVTDTLPFPDELRLNKHTIINPIALPLSVDVGQQSITLPKSHSTKIKKDECHLVYITGCASTSAGHISTHLDRGEPYTTPPEIVCVNGLSSGTTSWAILNDTQGSNSPSEWAASSNITWVNTTSYPNLYTGPTNGGVMPLNNSTWPAWTDACGDTYPNNPLVSSHQGVDGRTTRGSIDDYWVCYESMASDPYITGGWPQHAWGDAISDYMYTSQSAFGNVDGATSFFIDETSADPITCDVLSSNSKPDGTLGMKQFYQARGYAVGDCYNQSTDNTIAGGFSFDQFKAEIDAGWPVLLGVQGHTIVGVGYDATMHLIYVFNGWDNDVHPMEWQDDCYDGHCFVNYKYPDIPPYDYILPLEFASIVHIVPGTPNFFTISGNAGVAGATITYTGGSTISDGNGNYSFQVSENWFGTVTPSKTGITFNPSSRYYKNVVTNYPGQDFNGLNLLLDPGFESGLPDPWAESSTNNYIVLCTVENCGTNLYATPRTGSAWGWFGKTTENETDSLSQSITIPSGTAALKFYFWIGAANPGSDANDKFTARIDGIPVFTADATQAELYPTYTLVSINVSAYADGYSHTIAFVSETTEQVVYFNLDDVLLTGTSTISGNAGIAGTTLSYVDGIPKTVITDGSGNYSISVPFYWSGAVTPLKAGYIFSPTSRVYESLPGNLSEQNYIPTLITYTISGNTGISNTTLTYDGGSTTADGNGNYSFSVLPGWDGIVTPTKTGYTFKPGYRSYTDIFDDLSSQDYIATPDSIFFSTAANDGWTLESSEYSSRANARSASGNLLVGDNTKNRQYRSLLYFDTSNLPDNAVITSVTLKILRAGITGTDPFTTHGALFAEMKNNFFGKSPLENTDFQAVAYPKRSVGTFAPVNEEPGWYQLVLNPASFKYVNLNGVTQFRIRFTRDDDNDKVADFISFYSGDDPTNPPQLIVKHTTP